MKLQVTISASEFDEDYEILDDEALVDGVFARLKELNVRIVCLEWPKRV